MLIQEKADVTSAGYEVCSYVVGVNKRTSMSSVPQLEHALTLVLGNTGGGAVEKNSLV